MPSLILRRTPSGSSLGNDRRQQWKEEDQLGSYGGSRGGPWSWVDMERRALTEELL